MGGAQARSSGATYRVLRELGARSQRTYVAIREAQELVVLQPFQRASSGTNVSKRVTLADAGAIARLLRDARCVAKNFHPNIARVRHVDVQGDELLIATELVDGITLADLLAAREKTVPLAVLLRILVDVLGGLHGLHGLRDVEGPLGTFHGELCPVNVVLGKDGVARLVNVFRPRPVSIGVTSEALGYAAPEALDLGGANDVRADLYAVGVILWEGLTGRRLFDEKHPGRVLQRQREEDLARPAVPESSGFGKLADVAMRALAFDPALRFRSASELATELRRIAGTRLAPGTAVAQRVLEVGGERIRARRVEFDGAIAGTRKRSNRPLVAVTPPSPDESGDRPTHTPSEPELPVATTPRAIAPPDAAPAPAAVEDPKPSHALAAAASAVTVPTRTGPGVAKTAGPPRALPTLRRAAAAGPAPKPPTPKPPAPKPPVPKPPVPKAPAPEPLVSPVKPAESPVTAPEPAMSAPEPPADPVTAPPGVSEPRLPVEATVVVTEPPESPVAAPEDLPAPREQWGSPATPASGIAPVEGEAPRTRRGVAPLVGIAAAVAGLLVAAGIVAMIVGDRERPPTATAAATATATATAIATATATAAATATAEDTSPLSATTAIPDPTGTAPSPDTAATASGATTAEAPRAPSAPLRKKKTYEPLGI